MTRLDKIVLVLDIIFFFNQGIEEISKDFNNILSINTSTYDNYCNPQTETIWTWIFVLNIDQVSEKPVINYTVQTIVYCLWCVCVYVFFIFIFIDSTYNNAQINDSVMV